MQSQFFRVGRMLCIIMFLLSSIAWADEGRRIPILCYHNFNPTIPGSMNLTPKTFETQIQWLLDHHFTIIPLKEAVAYLEGQRDTLPDRAVVITVDDGWKSAYQYFYPIVKKYRIPVTLFIYPEVISEGKHFMTWDELKELQNTGLFDIESHTYSHPNFKQEKRVLSASAYEKFVRKELVKSKEILEKNMGQSITLLAWPFGIYNPYLENAAKEAGYEMAFTIDARPASRHERPMAQPRSMIVAAQSMKTFAWIVNAAKQ